MNEFMYLCGTPVLAVAVIVIPLIVLFNGEKIWKWAHNK
jgi:hypothetical protein